AGRWADDGAASDRAGQHLMRLEALRELTGVVRDVDRVELEIVFRRGGESEDTAERRNGREVAAELEAVVAAIVAQVVAELVLLLQRLLRHVAVPAHDDADRERQIVQIGCRENLVVEGRELVVELVDGALAERVR